MKNLLLIVILLSGLKGISQDHIRPILFNDITPLWQHLVVDSSRLDDEKLLGTKHLKAFAKPLILGDSIGYFIYVDQSEYLQGAYIEKVDLNNGIRLWSNVFNMSDSGKREFPVYISINDNGELEVLCMRNTLEDFYLLWSEGQLAIRHYDIQNGQLLDHIYVDDNNLSESDKLHFFPGNIRFYPIGDKYIYFTPYLEPLFTSYFKVFDSNAILQNSDSLKRDSFYISSETGPPYLTKEGKLIYYRHSFKQWLLDSIKAENYDSMRFIVDYYEFNDGLDSLFSIDLSDYFPYNWEISLTVEEDDFLRVLCKDSTNFDRDRSAFVFFDKEGEYIETLDFGGKSLNNKFIAKLPNSNNHLVFENHNDSGGENKSFDILISDGKGNLNKIKEISFTDNRGFDIKKIDILKNGIVLVSFKLYTPDPDHKGSSLNSIIEVAAFKIEDLGIVSTIEEEPSNNIALSIFPNPSKDKVMLRVSEILQGVITIYDYIGKKILVDHINSNEKEIDIRNLPNGIYSISICTIKGDIVLSKQFVK